MNEYVHHAQISTAMGVKICAQNLEEAIAGSELLVVGPEDNVEDLKDQVDEGDSFIGDFALSTEGVYVKASTLGSLEALLCFLQEVKKACIMKEKKRPEYSVILAFDVPVNKEAKVQAKHDSVEILDADIIYKLQDKFKAYMEKLNLDTQVEKKDQAVFPVILRMEPESVFHRADPIVFGCSVVAGELRVGTPLCIPDKDFFEIGCVSSIKKDRRPVRTGRMGEHVCVKIEPAQKHITIGSHFDVGHDLYSAITRESIDMLTAHFQAEMTDTDWQLLHSLKPLFKIT